MEPVRLNLRYQLPAAPERVWPILADTERLNRQLGLPSTRGEVMDRGPLRVALVKARFLGAPLTWEEGPFDWVEGQYYRVRRRLLSGPIREFNGGMKLNSTVEGTEVLVESEFVPANLLGALLLKVVLRKVHQDWDQLIERVKEYLRGEQQTPFKEGVDRALAVIRDGTLEKLRSTEAALQPEALAPRLFEYLASASDLELSRIRPLALARRWEADRYEVLKLCLHAARSGILDLSWDLICPNCRGAQNRWTRLEQVQEQSHCDDCQINFDANFDRAVEVSFRPNIRYRSVPDLVYCAAGPRNTPHIVAQAVLSPGESASLELGLSRGRYRIRNLTAGLAEWIYVEEEPAGSELTAIYEEGGIRLKPLDGHLQAGMVRCCLENATPVRQQAILERAASYEECLTAAQLTVYQEFRDLFSSELLSPTAQLRIESLPLLFTDLKGSTALYAALGDASAYALVRDHFELIQKVVARHGGGIIKTIGDSVMAAFPSTKGAVTCAQEMHQHLAAFNRSARKPLKVKVGIHQGPCIAVRSYDERLDYFGSTVNIAARAHQESLGNDIIITQEILRDPSVAALLGPIAKETFMADLRGIGEMPLVRLFVDVEPEAPLQPGQAYE